MNTSSFLSIDQVSFVLSILFYFKPKYFMIKQLYALFVTKIFRNANGVVEMAI